MPRFSSASLSVRLKLLVFLAVLPALGLTYVCLKERHLQKAHVHSLDANVYTGVSLTTVDPFAEADQTLVHNPTGLGLVTTLAIAFMWVGGELFILRWVRSLSRVSVRLAAGDLRARIGLPYGPGELSQLADAFNEMAESLERQIIERQQAEEELSLRNRELLTLHRISEIALSTKSLKAAFQKIVEEISSATGFPIIALEIYDEERQMMVIAGAKGIPLPSNESVIEVPVEETLSGTVARTGQHVVKTYIPQESNSDFHETLLSQLEIQTFICMPMTVDQRVIGVLSLAHPETVQFDDHLLKWTASLANYVALLTEQKRAEEALRESEERFRQIAENIREVIWMSDPDVSQMIYVSPVYEEMWGRTRESVYKHPRSFLDGIHPQDRDRVIAALGKKFLGEYNKEYRVVRPDGSIRWARSRRFPIHNQAGQVYRFVGLVEDITDRKHAEAEVRQLNETLEQRVRERTAQLEAANKELDSFSYSVSHDLRAPLRHISGFVDALAQHLERSGAITDPKVARYTQVIQQSSQRMGQLIDGLLSLSGVERRQRAEKPVELRPLVENAIALVMNQTESGEASPIEFTIGDLPMVMGDATLLQQVFSNLVDNAVKFSHVRHPARIEIGTLPNGTIFVKDNGVGFQMEYTDQLFGAFQRLHSQRQFKGTGIGLAIVQRIIHRHGGKIWAESAPNQGATFYFKLK